jgi:16S rRNA (adenine1518-N6/adenine1519-N6)-dimethyltransferase
VLTRKLLPNVKKLVAVERDQKFVAYLKNKFKDFKNFYIISNDVLKIDFPPHSKLISNVPYQISGPLIKKICISNIKAERIVLMLQKEFINRIRSKPSPKNYGRLSVVGNIFFDITELKDVKSSNFYPQPDVESGIIAIQFKEKLPEELEDEYGKKLFFEYLAGIFPYKNKTVKNCHQFFLKNLNESNFPFLYNKLQGYRTEEIKKKMIHNIDFNVNSKRLWELSPKDIYGLFKELFF